MNAYWRNRRRQSRLARRTAEAKAVDPKVFLNNPVLLKQVRSWIEIGSEEYARKTLEKTGVNHEGIEQIIKATSIC